MKKKVCLLTGASGRLGTAFCRDFASHYHIVGVYRNVQPSLPAQDQEVVDPIEPDQELAENRERLFLIRADLSIASELYRVVELALARFDRIDTLVNGA